MPRGHRRNGPQTTYRRLAVAKMRVLKQTPSNRMHQASLRHDCRQSGHRLHSMVYRTGSTQIDFLNLYSAWQTSNIRKLTTSIGGRTLSSLCANVAALKCHAYPVLRREKVKCTNHAWHSCLSRAISLHAKGNVFRRMCRCNFLDTQ